MQAARKSLMAGHQLGRTAAPPPPTTYFFSTLGVRRDRDGPQSRPDARDRRQATATTDMKHEAITIPIDASRPCPPATPNDTHPSETQRIPCLTFSAPAGRQAALAPPPAAIYRPDAPTNHSPSPLPVARQTDRPQTKSETRQTARSEPVSSLPTRPATIHSDRQTDRHLDGQR
ncbi:hypothetical protein B0T16DRAFT_421055 [Cercophora newfieldiana]|uniref:Uncharacterized protein n=1 Tax=Cercophora newfieldiana TaxID=92897 RepID=A0AA40CLS6_9PEZI|nr:hypothetical protein B0T16DRAFT_421055 [Cercophora newfieldiana]